jgi:hypothetical protein
LKKEEENVKIIITEKKIEKEQKEKEQKEQKKKQLEEEKKMDEKLKRWILEEEKGEKALVELLNKHTEEFQNVDKFFFQNRFKSLFSELQNKRKINKLYEKNKKRILNNSNNNNNNDNNSNNNNNNDKIRVYPYGMKLF